MKIGVRADGNQNIGMGHLQRCLSIAKEISLRGQECVFFVADQGSMDFIERESYQCINLESAWNDLEKEIENLKKHIEDERISLLLIDTYFVTQRYLSELQRVCRIAYIDDLFEVIYPYDLLINYAIYCREFPYEEYYTENTKLLLGTQYMLLREQFRNAEKKEIKKNIENILIMTGGADNYAVATNLVDVLLESKAYADCQINVVCGRFNKQYESLMDKAKSYSNLNILYDIKDMASIMKAADIAISASGTTLYELAAVGTPFICFTLADNQIRNAQGFHDRGLSYYVGDVRDRKEALIDSVVRYMNDIAEDYEYRKNVSVGLQELVDGYGARRFAENIMSLMFVEFPHLK